MTINNLNQLPEIQRSPLEQICLQIKLLGLGQKKLGGRQGISIQSVLSKALQPPEESSVLSAIDTLKQLRALTKQEELVCEINLIYNLIYNLIDI